MSTPDPLQYGRFYHIYNRGNSGEILFREQRNYSHFLKLYAKHIEPVAETYAYCLLSNHFHFLVRIKNVEEQHSAHKVDSPFKPLNPSRQFKNLFIAYAKAFNKTYQRSGALFARPFKRKIVEHDRYFIYLVIYIHRNPQRHEFVNDFRDWPYSSYQAIMSEQPTRINREEVLAWFGSRADFADAHALELNESEIQSMIAGDI